MPLYFPMPHQVFAHEQRSPAQVAKIRREVDGLFAVIEGRAPLSSRFVVEPLTAGLFAVVDLETGSELGYEDSRFKAETQVEHLAALAASLVAVPSPKLVSTQVAVNQAERLTEVTA